MILASALVFIMLSSGSSLFGFALLSQPSDPRLRGALLGLTGTLLGMSAFSLGALFGKSMRDGTRASSDAAQGTPESVMSSEGAKYWLQRFLDEHQRRRA